MLTLSSATGCSRFSSPPRQELNWATPESALDTSPSTNKSMRLRRQALTGLASTPTNCRVPQLGSNVPVWQPYSTTHARVTRLMSWALIDWAATPRRS